VFFLILWHNNKILYAPREFADGTTVREYSEAMSRTTRRSLDIVDSALTEAVSTLTEKLEALGATSVQRDEIVASVSSAARRTVLRVDLTALDTRPLDFPLDERTTVDELLDSVYFSASSQIRPYTYNTSWVLRDVQTGRWFHDIGTHWARTHLNARRDDRALDQVGIEPGSQLAAVWL
jgi:hypothetical protein